MYQVPHAGPPRRSWRWWLTTGWIILLSAGQLFYIGDRLLVALQRGLPHPAEIILVSTTGFLTIKLLQLAAQRARQVPADVTATQALPAPPAGFWVNLIACTLWGIWLLVWYLRPGV